MPDNNKQRTIGLCCAEMKQEMKTAQDRSVDIGLTGLAHRCVMGGYRFCAGAYLSPQILRAVSTTSSSFAHWSSSLISLP